MQEKHLENTINDLNLKMSCYRITLKLDTPSFTAMLRKACFVAVGLGLLAFSLQNYFSGGSHELNDRTKKTSSGKEI